MGAPTPPGWYPDPWQPGGQRWWDGNGWTAQAGMAAPAFRPPPPGDVGRPIADAMSLSRWARLAICAYAALTTVGAAVSVATFSELFDEFGEQFDEIQAGNETTFGSSGISAVSSVLGLVQTGALVVIGLWIMRSAEAGRALGRPADRSPGWGLGGFFVPIVNFWFPYSSLVQSLAPTTDRRPVLAWWIALVSSQLSFLVGLLLALAGVPIALLLGVSAVLSVATGLLGLRAVDAVTADHEAAAAYRRGAAAAPPVV